MWGFLASISQAEGMVTKGSRAFKPSFLLALPSFLCLQKLPGTEPPKPREEEQPLDVSDAKAPVGVGQCGSPFPHSPTRATRAGAAIHPIMLFFGGVHNVPEQPRGNRPPCPCWAEGHTEPSTKLAPASGLSTTMARAQPKVKMQMWS